MKFVMIALITLALSTSCSTVHSKAKPDVVEYTKEQQTKAAEEIKDMGCDPRLNEWTECKIPQLMEMLKDFFVIRRQAEIA